MIVKEFTSLPVRGKPVPRKQPQLSKTDLSRNKVQLLHPVPSPTCQIYLFPHWSSTFGTTLLTAGHSSSLFWLAPGSRRLSHCRAGSHHPPASLSACSFQPEISQNIYTVLMFVLLQNSRPSITGSTSPLESSSLVQTCLWHSDLRQAEQWKE